MKPDTGRAGIILAGGRSKRFDQRDKATATLNGTPLVCYVVEALAPVVDEVIINCRRPQCDAIAAAIGDRSIQFAENRIPDRGPVAGLQTGLHATTAKYAAVVACDMPFIAAGFLNFLFAQANHRTGAVAKVRGRITPLPAVVHVRAAQAACRQALTERDGRLYDLIALLDPEVVSEQSTTAHAGPDAFWNIDTRADLQGASERV
ncbi:molybdenum cofactor guanylyltransferase [Haladaptatus sp. CMSO5]|uniref:molybdenum cofactor guanylyltransferase n=1 Tax=Haladaptatus sp. CMSO5 TaxID=3120514 RepID=UPI002FCE3558